MHVNAKKIAYLGILLALAVLFVYGGTVIEINTLFFICAASFCLGIAITECGRRLGAGFFIACTLLTFILLPNKMYCLTLAVINFYVLVSECLKDRITKGFLLVKFALFNIVYIPALIFAPELIYTGKMSTKFFILGILAGQIAFYIYDSVYRSIIYGYWHAIRRRIVKD